MDAAELAYLEARRGTVARFLVWINARRRNDNVIESIGLWTGDDDQAFVIDGQSRSYLGGQHILSVPPIVGNIGLDVRMLEIALATTPAVEQAVRGYDPGLQRIEVHRALFNLDTRNLVAPPARVFLGTVDETPIESAEVGGTGSIRLVCASLARNLTRTVPLKRSNAALRARAPSDGFRKYVVDANTWRVPWGQDTV